MDGWTVTAEAGWTSAFCRQSGKERSFTPRGQGSFNPLALHFAQPLPLPACPLVHLPGVGALCAWSEKSCLLRLHFHINCPAALLPDAAPNLEGRLDGSTARRRSLPAGAQPELLIQEFPEIKRCISLPARARACRAVMRSWHCYRGKICIGSLCRRDFLAPAAGLPASPPSLKRIYHLPAWGATPLPAYVSSAGPSFAMEATWFGRTLQHK